MRLPFPYSDIYKRNLKNGKAYGKIFKQDKNCCFIYKGKFHLSKCVISLVPRGVNAAGVYGVLDFVADLGVISYALGYPE